MSKLISSCLCCGWAMVFSSSLCVPEHRGVLARRVWPTPRRRLRAIIGIREVAACERRALRHWRPQLAMQACKDLGRAIIGTQPEHHLESVFDQAPGPVNQLLRHCLDAPALGAVAHWRIRAKQAARVHQALDVHGQRGELAHQVVGIGIELGRQSCHVGAVRVPFDEPVHWLRRPVVVVDLDGAHQMGRFKARDQAQQDRRFVTHSAQALGNGDDALQIEVAFAGRVLRARAQVQFQTEPVRAQVGRQRTKVVDACIGATHALFGAGAVVHGEGVQGQPAARQHSIVRVVAGQQRLDHRPDKLEHLGRPCVHALAQCRTRGLQRDAQLLLEKGIAPVVLDGIKVALALHQQTDIAVPNAAVADPAFDWQRRIKPAEHRPDRLEVMPHHGPARHRREVVVQLTDNQFAHEVRPGLDLREFKYSPSTHPQGDLLSASNLALSCVKSATCSSPPSGKITDSGSCEEEVP